MTQANILAAVGSKGVFTGFRNRIINGNMAIDQRNAGASVTNTTSNLYGLDRWTFYGSQASKFTVQQNAGSVTPPAGFNYYSGITSSSAYTVGSSESFIYRQKIEGYNVADLGWGAAGAKTVTLSFWVYSSLTGSFGGSILNSAENYSYPFSYTVSSANTWQQISVTIAGPTAGTWLTTNGIGLTVLFSLGSGSVLSGTANTWAAAAYYQPTGSVSVVGTNGATFYITGVQLEVGTTATEFEYVDYGRQLAQCQRYYQLAEGFGGTSFATTTVGSPIQFKVEMRSSPSLSATAAIQITYAGVNDYTQSSANATIISSRVTTRGVQASLANFTGLTNSIYHAHNVSVNNAAVALNAEL